MVPERHRGMTLGIDRTVFPPSARLIVRLLFSSRGVTAERIRKAQGAAQRHKVDWTQVLAAMTDEQRQQVEQA